MANEGRQTTFNELKAYEARRRLAYTSKFDSTSLYWKSYLDLIKAALSETGRAQRLVLGTCRAHKVYGEALTAMNEDSFLDEKGNVATKNQRKRLSTARQQKKVSTSNTENSMLSEMRFAQQTVAEKFSESAHNMDEEIADAITSLLDDVKKQFSVMEELGSAILKELEKTELQVTSAWDRYLSKADTTSSTSQGMTQNVPQDSSSSGRLLDTWVVETQYRVAVAYQNAAWEQANSKLDELFREVKQQEINRRMNLREFLVAFVQRQQRLFFSLPGIHNSVLEELVGQEISREDIEKELKDIIKENAGSRPASKEEQGSRLESPLSSDLLVKAKVVERRGLTSSGVSGVGTNSQWKISLVIMTTDSYLHFFDLEDDRLDASATPESAFQVLMPNVVVPTTDNLNLGKSNFSRGWSDSLTPSDSMVLAKCLLHHIDETTITLVEKGGGGTTTSKMFGKLVDKKMQVRLEGEADKDAFVKELITELQ